jgi:hypothetical protein
MVRFEETLRVPWEERDSMQHHQVIDLEDLPKN